jgi:hypothetical protein
MPDINEDTTPAATPEPTPAPAAAPRNKFALPALLVSAASQVIGGIVMLFAVIALASAMGGLLKGDTDTNTVAASLIVGCAVIAYAAATVGLGLSIAALVKAIKIKHRLVMSIIALLISGYTVLSALVGGIPALMAEPTQTSTSISGEQISDEDAAVTANTRIVGFIDAWPATDYTITFDGEMLSVADKAGKHLSDMGTLNTTFTDEQIQGFIDNPDTLPAEYLVGE